MRFLVMFVTAVCVLFLNPVQVPLLQGLLVLGTLQHGRVTLCPFVLELQNIQFIRL